MGVVTSLKLAGTQRGQSVLFMDCCTVILVSIVYGINVGCSCWLVTFECTTAFAQYKTSIVSDAIIIDL